MLSTYPSLLSQVKQEVTNRLKQPWYKTLYPDSYQYESESLSIPSLPWSVKVELLPTIDTLLSTLLFRVYGSNIPLLFGLIIVGWLYSIQPSEIEFEALTTQNLLDIYTQSADSLLISGKPGYGKTTTLLQLAQTLIEEAEQNSDAPIPVLLSLATWQGHKSIQEWAKQAIHSKYGVSGEWSKIILLLDDLEDLTSVPSTKPTQSSHIQPTLTYLRTNHLTTQFDLCLYALKQSKLISPPQGVVLSVTTEVADLCQVQLNMRGRIILRPLSKQQIKQTLEKQHNTELTTHLQSLPGLVDCVTCPLMLTMVVNSLSVDKLCLKDWMKLATPEAKSAYFTELWAQQLLDTMNQGKTRTQSLRQRLNWLAETSDPQTGFSIQDIRFGYLSLTQQKVYKVFIGFIILMMGLGLVSFLQQNIFQIDGRQVWLNIVSIWHQIADVYHYISYQIEVLSILISQRLIWGGVGVTLLAIMIIDINGLGVWDEISSWLRWEFRFNVPLSLWCGLIGSLFGWLFQGFFRDYGATGSLLGGMLDGLLLGGFLGTILREKFETRKSLRRRLLGQKPGLLDLIRRNLLVGLSLGIVAGLTGGASTGALVGLYIGWLLKYCLAIVLIITPLILWFQDKILWLHVKIVRLILWFSEQIPWNYSQFLENAVQAGILYKLGERYHFSHKVLHSYFSDCS